MSKDFIREQIKKPASTLLHINLKYQLGQIYALLGEKDFALPYLDEVAGCGSQMAVSAQARALAETLRKA